MARVLDEDELIEHWTLVGHELGLLTGEGPGLGHGLFDWEGRTAERLRSGVRTFLGFRECSVADAELLTAWLADDVCCPTATGPGT